jgi:hypothetical protein
MLADGDLRRWTAVDALPADGMQEVWGSNPHISTGQSEKSKTQPEIFWAVRQQSTAAPAHQRPHICSDSVCVRSISLARTAVACG